MNNTKNNDTSMAHLFSNRELIPVIKSNGLHEWKTWGTEELNSYDATSPHFRTDLADHLTARIINNPDGFTSRQEISDDCSEYVSTALTHYCYV